MSILKFNTKLQRPQDFIVQYVIVPPVCIRPTVKIGGDRTNEDDMTIKVYEMLKQNTYLGKCISEGKDMLRINEAWSLLQNIHTQYINSETSGLPKTLTGNSSSRGIVQRLKGKTGRFRGNLSGKRVEFSARSVITPDPNLRIDQVAVPLQMAHILTFAECVTSRNLARLRRAVKNGPQKYPGANYITLKNETRPMSLAYAQSRKMAAGLKPGDIVHRHLADDDVILFNRQPSLHKLSIMGFRAKVRPGRTLRFNECVCNPFNADFDGDEMNIHLPQTQEARTEAIQLMGSMENLVNPKDGKPIITLTQDFLTCSFLLTQKDVFIDRSELCQILASISDGDEKFELPPPAIISPIELWTGKQVITALLAPSSRITPVVNLEVKEKNYDKKSNQKFFDLNDG